MLQRERLRRSPQIVRRHDATPAATYSSPRLLESSLFLWVRHAQKNASLWTYWGLGIRLCAWIEASFQSSLQAQTKTGSNTSETDILERHTRRGARLAFTTS